MGILDESINVAIGSGKTGVTLEDVKEARERIKGFVRHTPLLRQENMDNEVGCEIYIKPEMLQPIGAFKIRGAFNRILSLTKEEQQMGFVTSSSGNHAQACAYAGKKLGVHVTVVVPDDAPEVKRRNARNWGAEVIAWDRPYAARMQKVESEMKEHGYKMIHGFEDYHVMAGQGTIALEIMEDLPDVETVIIPIGGGGLISGMSTAIKETNPNIRVIGVQSAASCAYYASRQAGKRVVFESSPTVADGITCGKTSENPYPIIEKYVDEIVVVKEESIKAATKLIADKVKLCAEPTSAVTVAALLEGVVKVRKDEKVAVLLTAGNYDIDNLGKIFNDMEVPAVL